MRVTELYDGRFEVSFECKKVSCSNAEAITLALSESKLIPGASDLVRSQQAVLQAVKAP